MIRGRAEQGRADYAHRLEIGMGWQAIGTLNGCDSQTPNVLRSRVSYFRLMAGQHNVANEMGESRKKLGRTDLFTSSGLILRCTTSGAGRGKF